MSRWLDDETWVRLMWFLPSRANRVRVWGILHVGLVASAIRPPRPERVW